MLLVTGRIIEANGLSTLDLADNRLSTQRHSAVGAALPDRSGTTVHAILEPSRRLLLTAVIVVIVTVTSYIACERHDESVRRESQARMQRIKFDIDARFAVGAAKQEDLAFINATFPKSAAGATHCNVGYNCYLFYLERCQAGTGTADRWTSE